MSDQTTNFFQKMDAQVMSVVNQSVSGKMVEYASIFSSIIGVSIALYILWCGYMVFAGKLQRPIESIIWDLAKMSIMMMFMSNIGGYLTLSIQAIEGLKHGLSGQGNAWVYLDELWLKGQQISARLMKLDTSTYVKTDGMIGSGLTWFGIIAVLVGTALIFLIADLSIILLTTTAPVFIFCLMFGFLRTMFNNWLQSIFSAILTVMFAALVLSSGIKYLNHILTIIATEATDSNIILMGAMACAGSLICAVIVYRASSIAHQIAGVGVQGALEGAATAAGAIGLFGAAKGIRGMIGGSKAVGKEGWHQGKGFVEGVKGMDKSQREGGRIGHLAGRGTKYGVSKAKAAVERARAAGWKRVSNTSEQPQSIVPKKGKDLEWK
ncbi:type IV secretion system protein [Arsenophonus sp.]|uniref:type IV secretion system protein n=1 Tax=Arsenophonus sp. TaxID=1872640 RepID=UPI00285ECC50|nr:type IV secretion system protein [Arsenophonus sp.]MDR5617851.1 type IV secretion system protein [Arsenophonus sp.]